MKMSIDDVLEVLEIINEGESPDFVTSGHMAMKIAIDIVHKYQKIVEISKWNEAPCPYYKPDGDLFREIREEIEKYND